MGDGRTRRAPCMHYACYAAVTYGHSRPGSRPPRRRSPDAQGACRRRRSLAVGVPAEGADAGRFAADARGALRAHRRPQGHQPQDAKRGPRPGAARPRRVTVVDTSGVVDFLLGADVAEEVEALIVDEGELSAPDLLVFETLAVLRDRLSGARAHAAVEDLGDMPIELFPTLSLRGRAWELRRNVTAADALFVALAEGVGEPLATKDTGLATAAERHADVRAVRLGGV